MRTSVCVCCDEKKRKKKKFPGKKTLLVLPQRYKNPSILLHLVPGPPFLSTSGFPLSISIRVPLSHIHHLPSRPDRIYLVLESLLAVRF